MKHFFVTGILCIAGLVLSQKVLSQINGPVGWQDIQDSSWIEYGDKMIDYAPNGGAFTPKGTMKVLVIYAGLYEPGIFEEEAIDAPLNNWPTIDINGNHNTIPLTPEDLIFSNALQLSDPQYANLRNLTRYYYEMSKGSFILLGDVVRDPIPSSPTYGQPVRINVDPSGATDWWVLNQRVLQKLYTLYGSEWATMWLPFDTRTNNPNFDYDNSTSLPDNKIDLIIIQWRYSTGWNPQPITGMNNWYYSGNAVASTLIGTMGGYNFGYGFSIFSGNITGEACVGFFPHEIAHNLYNCPHLMGANSTLGNYFYKPDAGWGMMSSNNRAFMCANSWERWLLGWTDLFSNGENTDLQSAADLNSNGIYTVRDFLTTGDMIRVKVPQTTNTYLWIENHVKTNLFDYKLWAGGAPSPQGEIIPETDPGVYMFTENVAPTRDNFTLSAGDMNKVNAIKPLNAQGNFDYTRSAIPLELPVGTIDPNYYWNNEVYTFQKTNENPISGTNPWYVYIDDYRTYSNGVYSAPPNGTINLPSDWNGCAGCETKAIVRETDGTNTNMLYENTYGRNYESINVFGRRSDAFQATDEISKSGIVPALNIPSFTSGSVNEYVLNGLRVDVLTKDPVTGTVTLKVQFDDYELRNNKRWTGKIGLNDLTTNSSPDLIIDPSVELRIDKSGTNNRKTLVGSQFIDPTIFNCYNSAYMLQEVNSTVIVDNGSGLLLNSTSTYTVNNGAILIIRNGSTLLLKSGSNLLVYGTGKVAVEQGAYICIESGANITLNDFASILDLQAGFIFGTNPALNLTSNCIDFCSLTVNGSGSVSSNDTHIASVLTWSNNDYIVNSNLIIDATARLNVNNATLKFTDTGKLTVNPGGKLVIDNSILTDACGNLWQGIEVQGTTTASQYPILNNPNQGEVIFKNGAIIENAIVGIKTIATDINGNTVAGTTGGIITANNSTFRNNQVAVQFYPYQNYYLSHPRNNLSSFTKCVFETTQILNQPAVIPDAFVKLQGVNGINFLADTFRNTVPQDFIVTERGYGIYSSDAGYSVNALCNSNTLPCSSYLPNIFEGLFYGIYAHNISSLNLITINRSSFLNNNRSIYLSGVYNPAVTLNTFDVGVTEVVQDPHKNISGQVCAGYGLYLANVNTINNVQENQFLSTHNGAYGSLVWNSGVSPNEFYKNYYHNLKVGTQMSSNNSGLQIKCNSFNPNINLADIGITSGSIAINQSSCGSATSPAGNLFSPCISGFKDIMANNGVSSFNYYYHNNIPSLKPMCYTPVIVNPYSCADNYSNLSCPSKLNTGNTQMQLLANINTYNSQLGVLTAKIDGGSTQNLLNKVQSSLNSGQLKNALMAASPYLTDTVLIATLNRSHPLTPGHLKEVLVPNSPLTIKVFNVFNTKILPPGIKQQIVAAQTGTSARAILEQQISGLELQRSLAVSELMQIYMRDTTGAGIDNIIAFLTTQPDLNSKKLLVQAYLVKEQCSNAKTLLSQLPNQNMEDFNFYTINNLMADLCIAGKTVYDLTATQKQTVENIALSNTMVGSNAQAILTLVYGEWFPEIIEELTVPEDQTLRGYLHNNISCNNLPVPNDTIVLLDTNLEEVKIISPVVTETDGKFKFNYNEIMLLDENALYTFGTRSGAIVQDTIFKTIRQWITASPVNLNLKKLNAEFTNDSIVCINDTVRFYNKTINGLKPYSYSWSFAHGITSTLTNPSIRFINPGTYNISLIVTDALGCKDTAFKQLTIPACPSIFGTINESVDCGNMPVINDTIFVADEFGNAYDTIFAITNNSGQFAFNSPMIAQLDTNYNYAFKLKSGYGIAQLQFNSINYWKNTSPHAFVADHKEYWTQDFNMSDSAICSNSFIDLDRNIYVAGTAYYPNLKTDYMLIKYNPVGDELWHISYNPTGFGNYNLSDMKVDSSGNCILTGYGNESTVTVKINSLGTVIWSNTWTDDVYFGDKGHLAIDTLNNIYLASNILDGSGLYNFALTKYSANGVKLWSTINNTNPLYVQKVTLDKSGNIILLCLDQATSNSTIFKYNSSGTLLWATSNANCILNIAVGNDNSVYATGKTLGGVYSDFITVKFDANGSYQWSHTYSYSAQTGNNTASQIIVDKDDNIIVAGVSPFETTSGPPLNPWKVYRNCYSLIKYAPDGTELWNTILSIRDLFSGPYYIVSMVTDKIGNIYTAGSKQTTPYISGGSGSLGKPYYQFLTTKINTNGDVDWIESPYTTKENSSNLSDLIISDYENIYVTGTTTLNGIRTIKYVQCPSTAMLKSMESTAIIENENANETMPLIGNSPWLFAMPNPINEYSVIAVNTANENENVVEVTDLFGRLVKSITVQGGYSEVQIPRTELSIGIYTITLLQNGNKVAVSRMTVIE